MNVWKVKKDMHPCSLMCVLSKGWHPWSWTLWWIQEVKSECDIYLETKTHLPLKKKKVKEKKIEELKTSFVQGSHLWSCWCCKEGKIWVTCGAPLQSPSFHALHAPIPTPTTGPLAGTHPTRKAWPTLSGCKKQ